jgi:hypothetical protein
VLSKKIARANIRLQRLQRFALSGHFKRISVNPNCTSRSRLCYYTFVLLGLAVLVFAWGLQYKLSLYAGPHSAARHMVEAKLLAKDKQIGAGEGIVTGNHGDDDALAWSSFTLTAVFVPLLALSILGATSVKQAHEISTYEPSWRVPCDASFNAFSFRPPPIAS